MTLSRLLSTMASARRSGASSPRVRGELALRGVRMTRTRYPAGEPQLELVFAPVPSPTLAAPTAPRRADEPRPLLARLERLMCREAVTLNPSLAAGPGAGIAGILDAGLPWLKPVRAGQLLAQLVLAIDSADLYEPSTLLCTLERAGPGAPPGMCDLELMALHLAAVADAMRALEAEGRPVPVGSLDALEHVLRASLAAWPYGKDLIAAGEASSPTELYGMVLLRSAAYLEACEARIQAERRRRITATFERRCGVPRGSLRATVSRDFEARRHMAQAVVRWSVRVGRAAEG